MNMSDPYEKALYSPEKGMIASPAMQSMVNGSSRLPMAFSSEDWLRLPDETMVPMNERLSVWENLAALTREERIKLAEERQVREKVNSRMERLVA